MDGFGKFVLANRWTTSNRASASFDLYFRYRSYISKFGCCCYGLINKKAFHCSKGVTEMRMSFMPAVIALIKNFLNLFSC